MSAHEASESLAQVLQVAGGVLLSLRLSNTQCNLIPILEALTKGSSKLTELDISKNKMKAADCGSLAKFLLNNNTLTSLNLSGTKLPVETLKDIFSAVSKDIDLKLDLSDNSLGTQFAKVFSSIAVTLTNIHTLDLRYCGD